MLGTQAAAATTAAAAAAATGAGAINENVHGINTIINESARPPFEKELSRLHNGCGGDHLEAHPSSCGLVQGERVSTVDIRAHRAPWKSCANVIERNVSVRRAWKEDSVGAPAVLAELTRDIVVNLVLDAGDDRGGAVAVKLHDCEGVNRLNKEGFPLIYKW